MQQPSYRDYSQIRAVQMGVVGIHEGPILAEHVGVLSSSNLLVVCFQSCASVAAAE